MQKRIFNHSLLFAIALAIGLFVRLYGLGSAYIKAFDPYYFYRVAESFLEKGYFEPKDELRYYPIGWDSRELAPGVPWTLAYLAKLFGDLKVSAKWYPAIFGVLAVAVFGFLARRFNAGSIAALLLAVIPAFYYRTSQGFADKEPLAFFLGFVGWYFIYRAMEEKEEINELLYSLLAGISFGLNNAVWGGKLLFTLALTPFFAWLVWKKKHKKAMLLSLALVIEEVFGVFVPRYRLFYKNIYFQVFLGLFLFSLLLLLLEKKFKGKELYIAGAVSFLALLIFSQVAFNNPLYAVSKFLAIVASPMKATTRISLGETVAENQRPAWTWRLSNNVFWQNAGFALFLAFAVLAFLKDWRGAFIASIWMSFFYASTRAVRLLILLGPACALASAFVLARLYEKKERYWKYASLALAALLVYQFAWPRSSFALPVLEHFSKGTSDIYAYARAASGTSMTKTWFEALKWLKFNTPEREPIVTWWDYGYWIQTVANRTSVGDGGNVGPGPKLNHLLGKFLANENVSYSLSWLKSINASYVILDFAMIPKFWAYSTLGGMPNMIGMLRYQGRMLTPLGIADVYAGNSHLGPVAVAIANRGNETYPLLAKLVYSPNGAVPSWQGVVSEIITSYGIYRTKGIGKFSVVNNTAVVIYPGQMVFFGDYKAMHSFFARLWFMHGLGLPCKELLNNGEVQIYRCG